jgi:hypothetical protein
MITLKTLPDATAQEVFDQVAGHLLRQMQCSTNGGWCMYRGPDGLKCAAGCLIGDDEYDIRRMEERGWDKLVSSGCVPHEHKELIENLQDAHDSGDTVGWREKLEIIADRHGLTFNPEKYV